MATPGDLSGKYNNNLLSLLLQYSLTMIQRRMNAAGHEELISPFIGPRLLGGDSRYCVLRTISNTVGLPSHCAKAHI